MNFKSIAEYLKISAAVVAVAIALFFAYSAAGYISDAFLFANAASPECSTCNKDGGGSGSFGGGFGMLEFYTEHVAIDGGGGGGGGGGFTPYCTLTISEGPLQSMSYPPIKQYILAWNAPLATSFTISNGIGVVTPASGGTTSFTTSATPGVYTGTAVTPYGTVNCSTQALPPPPPAPICTLDLTQEKITWTTSNAFQVLIVPLTNSPQIPGLVPAGPGGVVGHTEGQLFTAGNAVKQDMLANGGVSFTETTFVGRTLASDQTTMNRVCSVLHGAGSVASNIGARTYDSCSNNGIIRYSGGVWQSISGCMGAHLSGTFSCSVPGTLATYPLNGSYTFVPPLSFGTHTYKLTATGTGGVVMCEDTITITPPAPTCTLTADPHSIMAGDSTVLSWTTTNSTSFSIDNGVGSVTPVAAGSKSATPAFTTTYTGTATGPGGTVTCTKKVTVAPPPPPGECKLEITKSINKYSAAPYDEVEYTLNFKNSGSKKCTGSGVMIVDTLDSLLTYKSETHSANVTAGYQSDPVYSSDDRTLRFNAWDLDPGETGWVKFKAKVGTPSTCTETVYNKAKITSYEYNNFQIFVPSNTVNLAVQKDCTPPPVTPTCTLTASPSTITTGGSSTLSWVTTDATSISIDNGVGAVSPVAAGSKSVSPSGTTTYTATVTGTGGTATCYKKVTVTPPPGECKLVIDKAVNKTEVTFGEYVEYTITFKNIGTKNCTGGGVHITDTLDSLLTYKSETHSSNVTAGYQSDPVYKSSTRTVHFNADTLTPGEEGWVKVKVVAEKPVACSETVPNVAKITAYEYSNFTRFETSQSADLKINRDCTPPPAAPTCTLGASPTSITSGNSSTLSWTTTNATSFTIDNGVGSVTPVASGSKSVSPTVNTTYTGTATGPGGTVTCEKKIKVTAPPGECKLTITKSVDSDEAVPGDIVEYTLTFKNIGTKDCTGGGVKVWDVLDSRLTYKSETHSTNVTAGYQSDPVYKSSDRTVRFNAATLTPGEEGWAKIKAKVNTPTSCTETIPNKAKITAYEYNNFQNFEESNTVNVQVEKDCTIPAPVCAMSISPTEIVSGNSASLSWTSSNVTEVTIDQGIGSVAVNSSRSVSPTADTTYTGTFKGPGGTVTCTAHIEVTVITPVPQCTLSVSASRIRSGQSVFVSWTSTNVTQGTINALGNVSPVSGGTSEVFPAEDTTYTGTFTGPHGTVTCAAPVTVEKGGGGCQGNCGGGLNQPNVVMLQKPPEAPLAFVTLEQIPYTGFTAGKELTVAFWLAIGILAALATYFIMGRGGMQFALGNALTVVGFGDYSAYDNDEPDYMPRRTLPSTIREEEEHYAQSVMAAPQPMTAMVPHVMSMPQKVAKPAVDGIPDMADVIESRAHGAGVLMSPEAIEMALELSKDRAEALAIFGDILNEAIRVLPREDGWVMLTSERFEDLRGKTATPAFVAQPVQAAQPSQSVEAILASVMQAPVPEMKVTQNVEMPMTNTDDQSVVMGLAKAILSGNRDTAYATVRNLETANANVASIMTVVAGAFDQLYRARRHGLTTDLSTSAMNVTDEALAKMVEIFTHGMDAGYSNAFTSLKLAVAQAFEARG